MSIFTGRTHFKRGSLGEGPRPHELSEPKMKQDLDQYGNLRTHHGPTYQQKLTDQVDALPKGYKPHQFYTEEVNRAMRDGLLTDWGVPQDISGLNQIWQNWFGAKTPQTSSLFGYGPFEGLTNEEIRRRMIEGKFAGNVKPLTGGNKSAYGNLVARNLLERTDEYGKRIPVKDFNDFEQNPDLYSLTRNVSSDISRLKELEKASQVVGKEYAGEGNWWRGLLGLDTKVTGNEIAIDGDAGWGQNTHLNSANGAIQTVIIGDDYEAQADAFMAFKPDEYEEYLRLKKEIANFGPVPVGGGYMNKRALEFRGLQEQMKRVKKELDGASYTKKDGTKVVTLMGDLYKDHVKVIQDAAANQDVGYAIGQAGQLAIEFIPGIGLFSGSFRGIGLAFKGGKLTDDSIKKLKEVC